MVLKLDYVLRETGTNLVRNVTLTLASVLTVVVSLTLFGSALLLQQGVENANDRFKGGIEFIVYLNPQVTAEQQASIERDLTSNPEVDEVTFVDQDETYEEFKRLFQDSQQLIDTVEPEILPPSFRVAPRNQDPQVVQALGDQFTGKPGVYEVVFAFEVVQRIQETFNKIGVRFLLAAVLLLVAALMLILNTIRVAMFARRREIEVMKLVGATNWFIRVPFILEGLVQALLGGLVATAFMFGVNSILFGALSKDDYFRLFESFEFSTSTVLWTSGQIGLVGMVIGAIGSGLAVGRFLDV